MMWLTIKRGGKVIGMCYNPVQDLGSPVGGDIVR